MSTYLGSFHAGDTVRIRVDFHNDAGALEDPTGAAARLEDPSGTFSDLAAPTKRDTKTGHYGIDVDTIGYADGRHQVWITGTVTTAKAVARTFSFDVAAKLVSDLPTLADQLAGGLALEATLTDINTKVDGIVVDVNNIVDNEFGLLDAYDLNGYIGLTKNDILGLSTGGPNNTVRILTATTLHEVVMPWPDRTLDPDFYTITLTDYETRPGWTFTARCLNWNRQRGENLYILGTTTDGGTTEDALIVVHADGITPPTFVSGSCGLDAGITSRGLPRPVYNATTDRLLLLWVDNAATTLKLSQWNGTTGAYVSTAQVASDVTKLENIFGTDDTYVYCYVIVAGVDTLRKISIANSTYTDLDLTDTFSVYNGMACTAVQVYDGLVYVSTDSRPVSTAVFNADDLSLKYRFPQGYGLGETQGMCSGGDYLYQFAKSPDVVNIIDKTGARVRSLRLPDTTPYAGGLIDAAEFPSIVFMVASAQDSGLVAITVGDDDSPYICRWLIDSTLAAQQSVVGLDDRLTEILAALESVGGLTGTHAVTLQFYRTATVTPIPDVLADVYDSGEAVRLNGTQLKSDALGRIVFLRDNGTYKVRPMLAGFNFTTATVVVADGNVSATIYGDAVDIPAPPVAGTQTLYGDVKRLNLAAATGDTVRATVASKQIVSGIILQNLKLDATIDALGQFTLTVPKAARIRVRIESHGDYEFTVSSENTANIADYPEVQDQL